MGFAINLLNSFCFYFKRLIFFSLSLSLSLSLYTGFIYIYINNPYDTFTDTFLQKKQVKKWENNVYTKPMGVWVMYIGNTGYVYRKR